MADGIGLSVMSFQKTFSDEGLQETQREIRREDEERRGGGEEEEEEKRRG